ncbi:EAL domain-containing protein [Paenibacillus sp. 1P07SE]|uniref:EAL domain-containing protein n=1 Tax=Paenibacillus sp. 1P07SE TaxID=3132209 RepID=UPI0039A444A0
MDNCASCYPAEPIYELRVEGRPNLEVLAGMTAMLPPMERHGEGDWQQLRLREQDLIGLADFGADHMELERMYYRSLADPQWQPFTRIGETLAARWVDDVILHERVVSWAQPILDAQGGLYAHEMLARFEQPDGSLLSPGEVFAAAKSRNRLYALDKLCRMQAIRSSVHLPKKVFINFIPTSIYSPEHCLRSTIALSRELGFEPSKFVFEVVETEQVEDYKHLKTILDYYQARGFQYALDDVGAGYSTIELLEDLKPHYMKLDRSYVDGVAAHEEKQVTALQMLAAARGAGAVPLAEGVEREADFAWLRNQGYELFQGYLFGRPEPVVKQ